MATDDGTENFDYDSILTASNTSNTPKISQANKKVFQSTNSTPSQPSQAHPRKPKPPTQNLKTFGKQEFSSNERERIRQLLAKKLQHDEVQTRPGAHGAEYTYVSSNKAIEIANDVFRYNGWSCSIVDVTPDFIEYNEQSGNFKCGVSCVVRVTLRDGTHHEDVGFGVEENKIKGTALENAKKSAVSDARKRALRVFGNHLGNCLYDKEYVKQVRAQEKAHAERPPTVAASLPTNGPKPALPQPPQQSQAFASQTQPSYSQPSQPVVSQPSQYSQNPSQSTPRSSPPTASPPNGTMQQPQQHQQNFMPQPVKVEYPTQSYVNPPQPSMASQPFVPQDRASPPQAYPPQQSYPRNAPAPQSVNPNMHPQYPVQNGQQQPYPSNSQPLRPVSNAPNTQPRPQTAPPSHPYPNPVPNQSNVYPCCHHTWLTTYDIIHLIMGIPYHHSKLMVP